MIYSRIDKFIYLDNSLRVGLKHTKRKIYVFPLKKIKITLGPGSPGVPAGPIGPIGPAVPFSPGGPTSPGVPCLPSCPGRPSAPGGPGGPGGPGSPGSPCYVPRVLRRYRFLPARALDKSVSRCSSVCATRRKGQERSSGRKLTVVNIQSGRQKKKRDRRRDGRSERKKEKLVEEDRG